MSLEGNRTAKEIFLAALELSAEERQRYVQEATAHDDALRARVNALLTAHDSSARLDELLGPGIAGDPLLRAPSGAASEEGGTLGEIADYQLLEKIASGAMGTVYRARQKSLDRIVALKVLRVGRFATQEEVRRFRAEAEAAARLDHPHIVPVFEVGEEEKRNFFSMKLIHGPGLDARVEKYREDPRGAARLVSTVARAVHHAHQHGVLHRDLKPSNILLDSGETPYVADFGIAKRLDARSVETQAGFLYGTPAYMAPEQLAPGGEVTVATDVYALGCVLYELLTGGPPFTAESVAELFREVREREPAPVRGANPRVHRDLATICHTCLAKEPERRYGSALELAEDLERWLDHRPIRARPASPVERALLLWRRKPLTTSLWAAVSVLLVVVALGGTATSVVLREYLSRAVRAERDAKERLRTALLAQARANLRGDRPGRRHESLARLQQAARIGPGADLRDEAITCMTLTDLRSVHEWEHPEDEVTIGWDLEHGRIAHALPDGRLSVRTLDGGEQIAELAPVTGLAMAAWFSPDGRLLAVKYHGKTYATDPRLCLWDLERRELVISEPWALASGTVQFDPAGDALVASVADGPVYRIPLATPVPERWLELDGWNSCVRFRPDGGALALAFDRERRIEIRRYPEGVLQQRLDDLPDEPMCLDWSPDGERIVIGSGDSRAYVVDVASGEITIELKGHQAEIVDVMFLADGLVVTRSWDESTRLWDLSTGETLITSSESARQASKDGKRIAYNGRGRTGVWAVDHGDAMRTLHGHVQKGPRWVDVSPSGRWLASGGDDTTLLWSLETGTLAGDLRTGKVGALFFSKNDDTLYTASENGLLRWPLSGAMAPRIEPESILEESTWRSATTDDEELFAFVEGDTVQIVVPGDPTRNRTLAGFPGMNPVELSPDGEHVAAGSWRGRGVRIWSARTGEVERDLLTEYSETTVCFSPDGERLIAGTPEDFSSWRVGTWEQEYVIPRTLQPTKIPGFVAFDDSGTLLAVAASTRVLWLVDASSGERILSLAAAETHPLTRLAFLPGARGLAAGTTSNRVQVWNLELILDELHRRGLDEGFERWPEVLRRVAAGGGGS